MAGDALDGLGRLSRRPLEWDDCGQTHRYSSSLSDNWVYVTELFTFCALHWLCIANPQNTSCCSVRGSSELSGVIEEEEQLKQLK